MHKSKEEEFTSTVNMVEPFPLVNLTGEDGVPLDIQEPLDEITSHEGTTECDLVTSLLPSNDILSYVSKDDEIIDDGIVEDDNIENEDEDTQETDAADETFLETRSDEIEIRAHLLTNRWQVLKLPKHHSFQSIPSESSWARAHLTPRSLLSSSFLSPYIARDLYAVAYHVMYNSPTASFLTCEGVTLLPSDPRWVVSALNCIGKKILPLLEESKLNISTKEKSTIHYINNLLTSIIRNDIVFNANLSSAVNYLFSSFTGTTSNNSNSTYI